MGRIADSKARFDESSWLAAIVESSDDAIVSKDLDGIVTSWNKGAERIFGYSATEVVGKSITLIIPPERIQDMRLILDSIRRGVQVDHFETERIRKDGRRIRVSITVSPIRDKDGCIVGASKIARDVTSQWQQQQHQRLLAEASAILARSLGWEETLANIAQAAVPGFADWCAVDVLEPGGELKRVSVAHVDPKKVKYALELSKRYPVNLAAPQGIGEVLRSGRPEIYPSVTDEMLAASAIDEEHKQILLDLALRSVLIVPVAARGTTIGTLSFISNTPGKFAQAALEIGVELGRRAGLAIENARLYESIRTELTERARAEAELEHTAKELRLLYEASQEVGSSLDPETIYDNLHRLVSSVMDCHDLVVSSFDPADGLIRCVYACIDGHKPDPSLLPPVRLNPEGKGMQSQVITTGEPLLVDNVGERIRTPGTTYYTVEADGSVSGKSEVEEPQTKSIVLVPLKLEDRVFGVVQVMSHRAEAYTSDNMRFLESLVIQVAAAARNAALFQAVRKENLERTLAEERYRSLVSAMSSVVFSTNSVGEMVAAQPNYERHTGTTTEACQGMGWLRAIHPVDRNRVSKHWSRSVAAKKPIKAKAKIWSAKHKGYRHSELRAVPLSEEDGTIREWVGTVTDVHDQRVAEDRISFLLQLNDRIRKLSDPSKILETVVLMLGKKMAVSRCSYGDVDLDKQQISISHEHHTSGLPTLGWFEIPAVSPVMDALKEGHTLVVDDVHTDPLTSSRREAYEAIAVRSFIAVPVLKNNVLEGLLSVQHKDPRHWEPHEIRLADEVAERAWLAFQNARTNAELEQRVQMRTAELEAANREMEGFTYSVSHDLRAPLRSIIASSRILLDDFGSSVGDEARELLRRQEQSASKLARLIDDLLRLSRLSREPVNRSSLDISEMGWEIATDLSTREGYEHIEFSIQQGIRAQGDPRLIRLVLQNLLENAAKFSAPRSDARVELSANGTTISVRDNGIGFDMEYAGKLFLPFERLVTAEEFPGTGVGLANVKRIIDRHNGQVWAESQPGQDTTFSFTLG